MRGMISILLVGLLLAPAGLAKELPHTVDVAGKRLRLNGAATFRKWFFSIYDVGLYLEKPTRDSTEVLASDQLKRLHVHLLRDAPRDQMVNLLRWRLQTVSGAGYEKIRVRVDRLLSEIPDGKKGTDLFITWVPDRGTVLSAVDGREVVVEGKDFADALFNVWLQDKRIRPGLLRQ